MAEILFLNVPEWILGEKTSKGAPPVGERIASSIAASRLMISETVAKGGRRKVAVLTGGANGLGYMTAMAIAEAGYHLIIGDRATKLGIRAVETIKEKTGNMNVEFFYLDLGSFKDVRSFAREVAERTSVIDLLINNAGVMDLPSFRPTAEGHDSQFGINHLGHYYLTHLLLPLVKKAPKARIVMTGSSAHYGTSKINYAGITSAKAYDRINNYCGSKLANVMYANFLARTLARTHPNITVNCLHPGSCYTSLFNHSWMLYILTRIGFKYLLRSPARGARTITYLALSEEVEGITGEFWFDERIRQRNPAAIDVKLQEELVSTRTMGENPPTSGSKLVQLQRQSSPAGSALTALSSSSTVSTPTTAASQSQTSIAGGALDFGTRADSSHHTNSKAAAGSGNSNSPSVSGGVAGTGSGSGSGNGVSAVGATASAAGAAATPTSLVSGGSLHPLHFNWVFWFMHRAPGSKILNYESSMKKIATFGSVEDFWAVYSHLKRPHELPTVSDYHLFKQGVRPVWEDATNINGGKWIVRLKKGLASRYWEDLVVAVIGDQFDVGSEICGAVLSIRGGEDILSLWNQSAHEGRINLKIRDTMKRVLNLPADTIMEYKTHNDALKDNSSFRNTDVFSKTDAPSTTPSDPMTLKAHLKRISRSTWLRLGSECHNAGFASDAAAALKSHKPAVSSVSMFSTAATAARAAALLYDSGVPRILGTIERRQAAPWQLEFLKSACPEVVVIAFADAYIEHGPKHGFERDLPTDLIEALDFEWRSNSGLSKRAVLALVQTLIACRRYARNSNNSGGDTKQAATKGLGLGLATSIVDSTKPTTDEKNPVEQSRNEQEHEKACHQLALTMAEACVALEVFFDTERGRNLPKLITLYQHELAADAKLQSRSGQAGAGVDRGIKRHGVGTIGAGSGALGSAGADPMDTVARKRFKSGGNEIGLLGSTPTTIAVASPLLAPSLAPTPLSTASSSTSSSHPIASSTTLRTSSHFVGQALAGYSSAVVAQPAPVAASTLSSVNAQQLAKLNNPLWSPVMGLTHLPQWPTKYAAQVESELERWISLLGHMDGAVFSEKLVGLIKSVYPSDQKFLLDQILIDYMCWEGGGSQEREVAEPAFVATKYLKENISLLVSAHGSNSVVASGTGGGGAPNPDIKTGEWVTETIMSTLVSLVIKPEESSTFLEPGSKKWIEIIEVPTEVENDPSSTSGVAADSTSTSAAVVAAGFGDPPSSSGTTVASTTTATASTAVPSLRPSAALGGAKKRRVRNLYNRRVSPFYAVLAMFQSKRAVGRVTGMLYSSSGELASHYDVNVGSNAAGGGPTEPGAGGVIGIDAQELLKQVGDTPTFPKLATAQTGELEEPDPDVAKLDRRRLKKQKRKEKKTLIKMRQQYQRRQGPGGDLDAEEGDDFRAKLLMGGDIDIDEQLAGVEALQRSNNNNDSSDANNAEQGLGTKEGEEEESTNMEGIEQDTNIEAPPSPQGPEAVQQDEWMAEAAEEEDALELAKQVEASRIVCQAPLKVLMFILQYLTRANQAGALDSWITDALSATLPTLQEQYFEWMLCNIIIAKSTPQSLSVPPPPLPSSTAASGAEGNQDQGETVVFEEELLRLLSVLVAAQGIGYEPAKTALETVERARQKVVDSLKDQEIQESSYWTRARTLLESH
ncbi:Eukaryotic translation initiation factor 4E type 2 [Mortierella sp. AD094]|nr:Eukaryotic translation initiation factor 4E type 2 [Mortierella sp. AD094]